MAPAPAADAEAEAAAAPPPPITAETATLDDLRRALASEEFSGVSCVGDDLRARYGSRGKWFGAVRGGTGASARAAVAAGQQQ